MRAELRRVLVLLIALGSSAGAQVVPFGFPPQNSLQLKINGARPSPVRPFLNLTGAGVSCVDDAPNLADTCTIAAGAGGTLQGAYNNGTGTVVLSVAGGPIVVQDSVGGIGGNLLSVANGAGTATFAVTASGPAFPSGATASGATAFDLSGSTGAFKTPTGSVTVGPGAVALSGLTTFSAGATASGATAFDLSGSTGGFKTSTGPVTIGPGAVAISGAAKFSGGASASGATAFDLSGSPATFKTPTGANVFGGTSNTFTNNITLPSQAAKAVLAAPSGAAGVPSFRTLVAADLPGGGTLAATYNNGAVAADQTPLIQAGKGGAVIFKANGAATGSLVEAQDSSANVLLNIPDNAAITMLSPASSGSAYTLDTLTALSGGANPILSLRTGGFAVMKVVTDGAGNTFFDAYDGLHANTQVGGLEFTSTTLSLDVNRDFVPNTTNTNDVGTSGVQWRTGRFATSILTPTINNATGVSLQFNGTTLADVGVTTSTDVTLAANKNLAAAAGTTALKFGSATGDTTLPTGNVAYTGASTKTVNFTTTGAGSSITLSAGAASTFKTTAGQFTLDGNAGINLQSADVTVVDVGVTDSNGMVMASQKAFGLGQYSTTQLPGTCRDGELVWDTTTTTVKRCKSNAFVSLETAFEFNFSAYNAANVGANTALTQTTVTNASTLESATITIDVVGVGAGNFVAKLCDSATCATTYATCTVGCTTAVGTVTTCTNNTTAIAAAATLVWTVATACGTDPGANMNAHVKNP